MNENRPLLTAVAAICCIATFWSGFRATQLRVKPCAARNTRSYSARTWLLEIHWTSVPGLGGWRRRRRSCFPWAVCWQPDFDEGIGNFFAGEAMLGMKVLGISLIGTFLMALCGATIGFFLQAKTQNRWTIFLACAAFTSIGATGLPGIKNLLKQVDIAPISTAYAAGDDIMFN